GSDARLDHGEDHAGEGAQLPGAVHPGGLQDLGGDALGELLHQKYAEGPAHRGQDHRPQGVFQIEERHQLGQGNDDDLLGQGHGADDDGKQDAPADEPLLAQGISRQRGGDAGEQHGRRRDEDDVKQPQEGGVVKELHVVLHRGAHGEPDGLPGGDLRVVLKRTGNNPVQGEQEEQHYGYQNDHGENLIALGGAGQIGFL